MLSGIAFISAVGVATVLAFASLILPVARLKSPGETIKRSQTSY